MVEVVAGCSGSGSCSASASASADSASEVTAPDLGEHYSLNHSH